MLKKIKRISILSLLTCRYDQNQRLLVDSNYPCLELISMVPKVFEPLNIDCNEAKIHVSLDSVTDVTKSSDQPLMLEKYSLHISYYGD